MSDTDNESTSSIGMDVSITDNYSVYFGSGLDGRMVLALKSDGSIIANPAIEPDEATKLFLKALEKTYRTLPAKIAELEKEEAESRRLFYEEQDRRQSAELRLEEVGRDTKRLEYILNLINERGLSGFGARIHWDCSGLDRRDIDYAMKNDGIKVDWTIG
jgi:hypothetical protein